MAVTFFRVHNPTSKLCEDEGSLPEGRYFKEYILYPNAEIKPACISDTESMCVIRWNNGNTTIYNNAITGARE